MISGFHFGSTSIDIVICKTETQSAEFGTHVQLHGDFTIQNVPQILPDQNPLFLSRKHYSYNSLEFNT